MSASKNEKAKKNVINTNESEPVIEVLYQKMGTKWFAFSLVGDDVFVGSIEQEKLDDQELIAMKANQPKKSNIRSA